MADEMNRRHDKVDTSTVRGKWYNSSLLLLDVYNKVAAVKHEHHSKVKILRVFFDRDGFFVRMPEGRYYFIDCVIKDASIKTRLEGRICRKCGIHFYTYECTDCRRESVARYFRENPEVSRAAYQKRQARKMELTDSLSKDQWNCVLERFGNCCALTSTPSNVHMDHFIALSTGHSGTVIGNVYPLSGSINISKNNNNPLEWFEGAQEKFKMSSSRWVLLISFLAAQNGLTPDEYRSFVDWCYANPRTVDEVRADNERYGYKKPSLEIWREATGLQFPIRVDFGDLSLTKSDATRRKPTARTRKQADQSV